jgi:hypothetical protein
MAITKLESFSDLHREVIRLAGGRKEALIYRGVKDATYKLIPKVGRNTNYSLRLENFSFRISGSLDH